MPAGCATDSSLQVCRTVGYLSNRILHPIYAVYLLSYWALSSKVVIVRGYQLQPGDGAARSQSPFN